ncbi:UNVERIFIED_CONTAM: hypothetical protein HDU68_009067 [Siphonaria sp. JEL0065]|nr:hypothetical protein HDU68_009067 [Siphonaria sp. JEL0065]
MIHPLSHVIQQVDALSATNRLDEGWRVVEGDVLCQRERLKREKEEEKRRWELVDRLKRQGLFSGFGDVGEEGEEKIRLKSSFKSSNKFVSGDVEDVILKMNGLVTC